MRVFVDSIPPLGIAMRRTALALRLTAPPGVEIVDNPADADIQVLHAVDRNVKQHLQAPRYAVMMHCLDYESDPAGTGDNVEIVRGDVEPWAHVWNDAVVVWSYYDLMTRYDWGSWSAWNGLAGGHKGQTPHYYDAPLGVDGQTFAKALRPQAERLGVLTTGHVSGPRAEAIEEVAVAASRSGLRPFHLGPESVAGMKTLVPGWTPMTRISEERLVALYNDCRWVSGLRHGEGFELPVIEGLACGVRPVCFDRPVYRRWFENHAAFVPDCSGEELVALLQDIFKRPARPVLPEERQKILRTFNWDVIGEGFWRALLSVAGTYTASGINVSVPQSPVTMPPDTVMTPSPLATPLSIQMGDGPKPKVVWIGDSPTTSWTGFGRASKYILDRLVLDYDVTVIGTTHDGSPYDRTAHPYDVYPLNVGVAEIVTKVRPSVVFVQHDPWQVAMFQKAIGKCPTIAAMPIDGKNCKTDYLNGLALAIWWTDFAEQEGRKGGYAGPSVVIPLGVDTSIYQPTDRIRARRILGFDASMDHAFIVGYIARNQHRKRLDLAVHHFCSWAKEKGVHDAYLLIQTAATQENAYDVMALAEYERMSNRVIHIKQGYKASFDEGRMMTTYNAMDMFWSTTQGEGFGLPAIEAMACGIPCGLPDWSGYGDWAAPAAHLVPIADISGTINGANPSSGVSVAVLGGVPSRDGNIAALDRVYRDTAYRAELRQRGLMLVQRPEFRWQEIGDAYRQAANWVLSHGPLK